ncbi:MAG TPA: GNAT family protein [Micrococcaceae bacterium]|jgi:RimJ/RimL family protein N-acetyltransferase|nr:GNAT family protein [Micrococcaceae bacterium]
MMATVPVLSDGVVTLRPFAAADAAAYAALNREPENVRWSASQAGMTESQALHAITGPIAEGWRIGTTRRLAIIGPDGELAGTTALHNVNNGSASLGIKLTAAARGRGLARRSVQLMVDYAFGPVALQVLHWHAVVGNEPSRRLAEAAGFRLEGTVRGYSYADGAPADAWIFSLLPADLLPGDPLPADLLPGDRLPTQPPVLDLEPVVPVLSDGTVTLRALKGQDLEQLVANCQDPDAVRWTTVPLKYTAEDARTFIFDAVPGWWKDGTQQNFAVADARTDTLLGSIGLHAFRAGVAEVGINMGPHSRGTGAAERACRLLLDYAFGQLNLRYLYWRAVVPNWASRKLAWKLGFRFDAELRGFLDDRGTAADAWILSLAHGDVGAPAAPWDGPACG